jgi:hypothetical protein
MAIRYLLPKFNLLIFQSFTIVLALIALIFFTVLAFRYQQKRLFFIFVSILVLMVSLFIELGLVVLIKGIKVYLVWQLGTLLFVSIFAVAMYLYEKIN